MTGATFFEEAVWVIPFMSWVGVVVEVLVVLDVLVVLFGVEVTEVPVPCRSSVAAAAEPRLFCRCGWLAVVAATRARSESDTASMTPQCGRIRCGRARRYLDFVRSPAMGGP